MRKLKILHITRDDKFFDNVYARFEADSRLSNQAVIVVTQKDYRIKYIKCADKVEILWNKSMVKELLAKGDYDVAYFYAFPPPCWYQLKYIPDGKTVIWWAWGYDIYFEYYGLQPLLPVTLFKPLTKAFLKEHERCSFVQRLRIAADYCIRKYKHEKIRKKYLGKFDYFEPVLSIEYEEMKKHPSFNALETYFSYKDSQINSNSNLSPKPCNGNILFGNSATDTNNHLDVWEYLKNLNSISGRLILPISYGDNLFVKKIKDTISSSGCNATFLEQLLPSQEYFGIVDTCSYMISGVMREQSIGNIFHCLQNGIKLFLFKDSIVYKYCIDCGFIIFSIEEIDESSFFTPLTRAQAMHNYDLWAEGIRRRALLSENCLSQLIEKYCFVP